MSIYYNKLRWTLTIAALALSSPSVTYGQHTSAVKAHTFRVIGGLYTVGFEQALNEHLSVELSVQGGDYIYMRLNRFDEYEASGIGTIGAIRYFPFTKRASAPRGFFGYTALRYIKFNEKFRYIASGDRYEAGGNIVNAGLGIGYKFVYRRVGLEAFIGWGAGRLKREDSVSRNQIPMFYQNSIKEQVHFPQLDVALCYMFTAFHKR